MNYHSEEYDDRENKILEESEESRKKHKEIEERYGKLVEKKAAGFDIEESLAILKQEYGIEFNRNIRIPKKSPVKISIDCGDEEEDNAEEGSLVENEQGSEFEEQEPEHSEDVSENSEEADSGAETEEENSENTADDDDSINEETEAVEDRSPESSKSADGDEEELTKIETKFMEAFPEDGRFKAFYKENIGPLLNDPEFKEIRDFIYEEEDFSNEKYELVLKAFEEKTGISYGSDISGSDDEGIEAEREEVADRDITFDDLKEGAKRVHAVPVENEKAVDRKTVKSGAFYMSASLIGIVILVGSLIVYSIW